MKRRKLSLEEKKLWEKVAKSTLPLNDKLSLKVTLARVKLVQKIVNSPMPPLREPSGRN